MKKLLILIVLVSVFVTATASHTQSSGQSGTTRTERSSHDESGEM